MILVGCLAIAALGCFVYQLLLQNGKLTVRLDRIEQRLLSQGVLIADESGVSTSLPDGSVLQDLELAALSGGGMTFSAKPKMEIPGATQTPYRVNLTASCEDAATIPKVPGAGEVFLRNDGALVQRMHNGLEVIAGAYHGEWMREVIRRLKGHHEPQEELVFYSLLPFMSQDGQAPVMVELGAFWGYYSLWFRLVHGNARNILVEPDPGALLVGRHNFDLNGFDGEFLEAAVGLDGATADFVCESDGSARRVKTISVDGLIRDLGIEQVNLLHADIQGAELSMLEGAQSAMQNGRLKWLFISTHHHSISGDPLTHQRCISRLKDCGASIVCEHSVSESFSGDGLIVAVFGKPPACECPAFSWNRASQSLFRETEYDLAESWEENRRLKGKVEILAAALQNSLAKGKGTGN
jgi:FkbM family methyltransferase